MKTEIDKLLAECKKDKCPGCGQAISQGDIAWNNGGTEFGTPFCWVECICPNCSDEIFGFLSWYPEIEDLEDLLYVLETDMEDFVELKCV